MEVTLTIPDDVAADLQHDGTRTLSRRALELMALDGFSSGELTEFQLQKMLGFDDRFEVHGFLKSHGVYLNYTVADLEKDSAALEEMLKRQHR